ncbi:MAG: ArgE/DapE family deacylase [Gemmatimonadota bacterium]
MTTRGDARSLLELLVRVDSRNPGLVPGAPGESVVANVLASVLREWGFSVSLIESGANEGEGSRPSVVARIGPAGARRLMFNGHLDTVGVDGMLHSPFEGAEVDGILHGRGACDMKGGIAAMCAAAVRAADEGLAGEIIIAAVADEEFQSAGTRSIIAAGVRADAAIVTEPTALEIHPAHRGFTWAEFTLRGRAAHGSRYDIGVDAIAHAAVVLGELRRLQAEVLDQVTHPLLGHASLHASSISGGSGWSTYPDSCSLGVERRTLPGESTDDVMAQFMDVCLRARAAEPLLDAGVRHVFSQVPSDVPVDAPIVRALADAMTSAGHHVRIGGMTAWTDAALLNDAGIPAICFGPGDIMLAHAASEWLPLAELDGAVEILKNLALSWARQ